MTAFRIIFQWHLYRRLYAGDYLVIAGFIALTSLTAVNVKILPHGYLMAEYIKSLTDNPLTPLPLPADELVDRTIISLKWAFSLMPLFWTTVWAGMSVHDPILGSQSPWEKVQQMAFQESRVGKLTTQFCSQILHPLLHSPSPRRITHLHDVVAYMLCRGVDSVSRLLRIALPSLLADRAELGSEYVFFFPRTVMLLIYSSDAAVVRSPKEASN